MMMAKHRVMVGVKRSGFMHMAATKDFVLQIVADSGTAGVLPGWTGTVEEALEAIRKDPRKVFPIGDCDNQDECGYCKGHGDHAEN
jgi:hypothetical protein